MRASNTIQRSLLALLILLLAACGSGGKQKGPSEQVTITFACYDWQKHTYQNLADQFEAANSDIHVQLILLEAESDPNETITQADTLVVPVYPSITRQGLVHDLTPFIEADRAFRPEDFYPNTLESLRWNGGTWGLPFAVDFQLIFYDKDAFDAAGVAYPEPGWTWDDFLTKAQALTEREGETVVHWGFVWRLRDPLPFIQGRGGSLMDTSVEPPVPLLDRPEMAEAVRWFTDLALVHQVMPMDDGQAAMWNESTRNLQSQSMKLGMVPFPVDAPTSATTPIDLADSSYAMSAGTAHPQESWRWLAFLSRQPVGRGVPARRSVAEQSGYWNGLNEDVAVTYRFALEHGFSEIESVWVGGALHDAVEAILREEQNVEEALAQAQVTAYAYIESEVAGAVPAESFVVPTSVPASDEGLSITFLATRTYWGRENVYDALAERFHKLHPEITVEVEPPDLPKGTSEVTLQQVAAQGDCLEVFAGFLGGGDRNVLMNLDPLIEADAAFPLDDFDPHFLEPFRHTGQLWALPVEGYPRVMYYNKELFNAADLAYPSLDWTLDDFLTLAAALTGGEGTDKQYGYGLSTDLLSEPVFFVEQRGARLVDDSAGRVAFTLDTPAMAEAVRWYTDLIRFYGVASEFEDHDPDQIFDLWIRFVREEQVAMWSLYPIGVRNLWVRPDGTRMDVGVAPMPQGPGRVGDFDVIGYSISRQTEHAQACWEWLKFLSEQAEVVQGVPARHSIAGSDTYRRQVNAELANVYLSTLERSERLSSMTHLRTERTAFVLGQFRQALDAVLNGEDVEQALSKAQHKVNEYVLCLETTTGYESERELINACINRVTATES